MEVKQVIVIRKDLNMRKGKMVAQGSHASLGVITNLFSKSSVLDNQCIKFYFVISKISPLFKWLCEKFTKIVVSCDSEEELFELHKQAKEKGILCCLIKDSGKTEFNGVPTYTSLAIGPDYNDKIDEITSKLKLL